MLLVFGLNLLALTAACLAMSRHHRDLFGAAPSDGRVLILRSVALLDGGMAMAYCINRLGVENGLIYWFCLLMLASGLLVALLAWRPRWTLPTAAGMPLLGGMVAVFA